MAVNATGSKVIRKLAIANLALLAILLASAIVNAWTHGSIAQSVLSSLSVVGTDPTLGNDSTSRRLVNINGTFTGNNTASGFPNTSLYSASMTTNMSPGGLNNGTDKNSWYGDASFLRLHASGQKFGHQLDMSCYGMGDCGPTSIQLHYAGGPVSGDEGSASVNQSSDQQKNLVLATVSGSTVVSSCNTTLSGSIARPTVPGNGNIPTQSVAVASTTGCNVNDWITIGDQTPMASSYLEAVQITAVGGGNITAAFRLPHSTSDPVRGATVIGISGMGGDWGQDRVLVNLSGTSYTTGTVSSISGGGFTGSGTTWTNGMVGGNANNIGCVSLANDNYSGSPFDGSGAFGTLKSWYQIYTVVSNTSLGIFSNSIAGDASYHGRGAGSGAYTILPCVRVLQVIGNSQVIAENSATTWANGNNVELALSAYPDVTMLQYEVSKFSPGGTFRGWANVTNSGARLGNVALNIDNQHMVKAGTITAPGSGYTATGNYPMTGNDGIPVTGGAGSGMRAAVSVSGGVVSSFNVVEPGTGYRTGDVLSVANSDVGGAGSGFQFTFNGSDYPVAWGAGLFIQGTNTAIDIDQAISEAILLGTTNIASSKIRWNNGGVSLWYDPTPNGIQVQMIGAGQGGLLSGSAQTSNGWGWLNYNGFIGTTPNTVSTLPTCDATHAGMGRWVTNSTGTTFGSVVTPGGGSGVGQAMCDGTNWVLH